MTSVGYSGQKVSIWETVYWTRMNAPFTMEKNTEMPRKCLQGSSAFNLLSRPELLNQ